MRFKSPAQRKAVMRKLYFRNLFVYDSGIPTKKTVYKGFDGYIVKVFVPKTRIIKKEEYDKRKLIIN